MKVQLENKKKWDFLLRKRLRHSKQERFKENVHIRQHTIEIIPIL